MGLFFGKKEIISLEKQFKSPKVLFFFFEENVPCFTLHLCQERGWEGTGLTTLQTPPNPLSSLPQLDLEKGEEKGCAHLLLPWNFSEIHVPGAQQEEPHECCSPRAPRMEPSAGCGSGLLPVLPCQSTTVPRGEKGSAAQERKAFSDF